MGVQPAPPDTGPPMRTQRWFVTVVMDVYASDIFKAHQEAEAKLKSMMGEGTWGISKVSHRLGEEDDD